jgi:hypothetical protein
MERVDCSETTSFDSNKEVNETNDYAQENVQCLHERMNNLNTLARRRSSLDTSLKDSTFLKKEQIEQSGNREHNSEFEPKYEIGSETVAMTESSKRILSMFDRYQNEHNGDNKPNPKQTKRKRHLNRLEIKRIEKSKKVIESIHRMLQNNSSRYLSRYANSLQYKIPKGTENEQETYPIPIQETEMNPSLLITLSCEKIVVESGKRLLKTVALHETSQELFIQMYWLTHCRFFQSNSGAEQRYLLQRVAELFPKFMAVVKYIVPVKHGDFIFKFYPFVLSKAIADGFEFLCPGNRSLFKGTFQSLLYLSVFRLLTGLNVCPASIHAQRLKVFPGDAYGEEKTSTSELETQPKTGALMHVEKNHITRQQHVEFDAYQLSPLLQNCLKRQTVSKGKSHLLKRTEPVSNCKSGGIETYHSLQAHVDIYSSKSEMIKQSKNLKRDLEAISTKSRKQLARVIKTRDAVLSGGNRSVGDYASKVMSIGS